MSHNPVSQSIRDRLLDRSKELEVPYQQVLTRYGHERLLYRVQKSTHHGEFLLKGATLFLSWTGELHRPTKDADFLTAGEADVGEFEETFREIIQTDVVDDGIEFDEDSISGSQIREDDIYEGIRIQLLGILERAKIHLQADLGFGDTVTPSPEATEIPALLQDIPSPRLRGYPRETTVAEKVEAMVELGAVNTRMKDFYDVWRLANPFRFDGESLRDAIQQTFERRGTPLPESKPVGLRVEFAEEPGKRAQWSNFLDDLRPGFETPMLETALEQLANFVWPPMKAGANGQPFGGAWKPEYGWDRGSTSSNS